MNIRTFVAILSRNPQYDFPKIIPGENGGNIPIYHFILSLVHSALCVVKQAEFLVVSDSNLGSAFPHYCRAATSSAAIIKWNSKPGTSSPGQTPIDGQEWLLWTPNSLPGHQPDVDLEWALTCFLVKLTFLCLQDTLHPEKTPEITKQNTSINMAEPR